MNGGWGTYSLENSSQSLFTASFVSADGQVAGTTWSPSGDDNEDPLVRIAGANVGSGTFTVTDLRSKATMTSMVTVLPDVASVISVNPSSLSFSGVPNGAYIDGFTVSGTNLTGNLELNLEDNSGFFTIDRTSISATDAQAGVNVEVEYKPTSNNPSHTAKVTISGGGAQPKTVTLNGSAVEPLSVTPMTLTFSNVVTNTEETKTFRIKGYTASALTLSKSGTSSFYTLSPTTITPAQARDGIDVTVTYKPTSAGTHDATVNIKNSDNTTIETVTLNGTAITPTITVNPSSLTFSGVPNGAYINGFTVFGANLTGNLELELEDNSGFFTINRTNINAEEAETASGASVEVEYKPTSNNPSHTATVTISGGGAQSKTVTLHGSAVEPFSVTPETLTFSNVVTNTEETKTFRIKGYTASALSLSLSGTSSYYTLSKTSITPAQARDGIDVTVTYKPTSAGTHNATVNIKKSNGTTIATVTLNATAVTPTITVNPSSLSFSGVPNGAYLDGFTVKGTNLTGSLKLELKDNSGFFTIDRTSITAAQAASGVSIGVEYSPTRTGHSAATVIISGGGAETKTVQLTGLCKN